LDPFSIVACTVLNLLSAGRFRKMFKRQKHQCGVHLAAANFIGAVRCIVVSEKVKMQKCRLEPFSRTQLYDPMMLPYTLKLYSMDVASTAQSRI